MKMLFQTLLDDEIITNRKREVRRGFLISNRENFNIIS